MTPHIDLSDLDHLDLSPRARRIVLRRRLRALAERECHMGLLARLEAEHKAATLAEWTDADFARVAEVVVNR
jgi:hypothetical protein